MLARRPQTANADTFWEEEGSQAEENYADEADYEGAPNGAEEFPTYDEEGGEDDEAEDYDSEDGTLVPMVPEDLDRMYEEEGIEWALANYQDEGKTQGQRKRKR